MKRKITVSLSALIIGMMWSGVSSATILSNTSPNDSLHTVTNKVPVPPSSVGGAFTPVKPPVAIVSPPGGSGGIIYPTPPQRTQPQLVSEVAEGCTVPKLSPTRHAFYVDPVRGKITNAGTYASPWSTLSDVLAKNLIQSSSHPTAPVKPGDIIYLMSGSYGVVAIQNMHNTDFITIAAAPGQTPVLDYLVLSNDEKWLIHGLKIQSIKTGISSDWHSLVAVSAGTGTSSDIILDSNLISSQDDVSAWSQADWQNKARVGILSDGRSPKTVGVPTSGVTCLTETNNMITHVRTGVSLGTDHTLFSNNKIDYFSDDALDYDANNLVISNNTITNSVFLGYGNHDDSMQGQVHVGPGYDSADMQKYHDITITGNLVISQTDPKLKFPDLGLQGIDAFDSDWTNVNVSNNTIIVSAYHGISFSSVHNAVIANNTVLPSASLPTWIDVGTNTHEGAPSTNVVVRNNLTWNLVTNMDVGILSNNLVGQQVDAVFNGKPEWNHKVGTYGNNNRIVANFLDNFTTFDNVNKVYNLKLVPQSEAQGFGSSRLLDLSPKMVSK